MRRRVLNITVAIWVLLLLACPEQKEARQVLAPSVATGSIRGNISPISVYDAQVEVLQEGKVIVAARVQDGVFHIKNLPPGRYNLRISAFGYVTNGAIRGIEVVAGQIMEAGRAVIFPQDTGEYIPTRITGAVYDAVTGAPIAGAVIKVKCNEAVCSTLESTSDSEGQFEIAVWANLSSIVTVTKQGYQTGHAEIVGIPTGESVSVALKLKKLDDQ
jgi:hypothetical protein